MRTTVKAGLTRDSKSLLIMMDAEIDRLRKSIWRAIFQNKPENMSDCDVAMSLGLVMYELIHHSYPTQEMSKSMKNEMEFVDNKKIEETE